MVTMGKMWGAKRELSHYGDTATRTALCGTVVADTGIDGQTYGIPIECGRCKSIWPAVFKRAEQLAVAAGMEHSDPWEIKTAFHSAVLADAIRDITGVSLALMRP